jgi:cytochrome c peroxidase
MFSKASNLFTTVGRAICRKCLTVAGVVRDGISTSSHLPSLACAAAVFTLVLNPFLPAPMSAPSQSVGQDTSRPDEPVTPIAEPPMTDPRKTALGERLFRDPRLSRDNSRSCSSCHDLQSNGASANVRDKALDGLDLALNTSTVFNAALSFRFNWEGKHRTLEDQAKALIENPRIMGGSVEEAAEKLRRDPEMASQFRAVFGRAPDGADLLEALVAFERSLVTPGSRFDRWLAGDTAALSGDEVAGYELFKSLGCVSCHQGVNIGGNLFQRHGIFSPLATPEPAILRVPSLRNIATTPPYFHDGSAPTLGAAVRRMARAQLNARLTDQQAEAIVTYLRTLTGDFRGRRVGEPQ